jgi:hypothetical protein
MLHSVLVTLRNEIEQTSNLINSIESKLTPSEVAQGIKFFKVIIDEIRKLNAVNKKTGKKFTYTESALKLNCEVKNAKDELKTLLKEYDYEVRPEEKFYQNLLTVVKNPSLLKKSILLNKII